MIGPVFFITGPKDNIGKWTVILKVTFFCKIILLCCSSGGRQKQKTVIKTSHCEFAFCVFVLIDNLIVKYNIMLM